MHPISQLTSSSGTCIDIPSKAKGSTSFASTISTPNNYVHLTSSPELIENYTIDIPLLSCHCRDAPVERQHAAHDSLHDNM